MDMADFKTISSTEMFLEDFPTPEQMLEKVCCFNETVNFDICTKYNSSHHCHEEWLTLYKVSF